MADDGEQAEARPPIDGLARDLVSAARRDDAAAFGTAYGAALDDPSLDTISRQILGTLQAIVQRWVGETASAPSAIEAIHEHVAAIHPHCTAIVAVNLVVLEHVARSVIGLSTYLETIESSYACLYGALLAGAALTGDDDLVESNGLPRG
jgi:hypothetical protein